MCWRRPIRRRWHRTGTRSAWSAAIRARRRLGDHRGRRHRGRRRRGARPRAAAGPPSAAAARRRHRRRKHRQRRAAAPADPQRAGAVHRAHQRRLRVAGSVRRARRRAGTDRGGGAGAGRGRPGPGQVGGVRPRRERRRGARGDVRRGRRAHRRLLALQLGRHRHRTVPRRTRAHHRRSAASDPWNGWPRIAWR